MADKSYMKSFQPDATSGPPGYMKSFQPDAPDPAVVAHAAADASPDEAAAAVGLAKETGTSPTYVAQDIPGAQDASDRAKFAAQLRGRPALTAWAAQSPQHAAAVKGDAAPLGAIEGWFSGIGNAFKTGALDMVYGEALRERQAGGGPLSDPANIAGAREHLEAYDKQEHGYGQEIARAAPQMALYGAATYFAGGAGLAGLLYSQNKGALATRINDAMAAKTAAREQEALGRPLLANGKLDYSGLVDDDLTPAQVDKYATAGSIAAAITLAGALGPLARSLPGARSAAQATVASVLTRAATTTVGQAVLRSLSAYGQHTMLGALGMTLQATINSATVQKAAGSVDAGQLAREGVDTFVKVLPIAATFAAYGPAREFLEDRARINGSVAEQAKLDAMVEQAQKSSLVKGHPGLASDLFGAMGRGLTVYIDHRAAAGMKGIPPADVAAATVAKGDVAVPAAEYLARMADQHGAVRDEVKLSADGMTVSEARARDKEMRQALSVEDARALYGRLTPDELQGLDMPLAVDMPPGMARNLTWGSNFEPPARETKAREKTTNARTPTAEPVTEAAAPEGQEAWHGSAVQGIQKFQLDKVGTGEGNTGRGHGVYFSASSAGGEYWRKQLTAGSRTEGQNYKVAIPAADELLHWEKPVGEQAQADVLEKLGAKPEETGGDFYDRLAKELGSERAASEKLREAGVPGSSYPRGEKRNSVIWDESRIKMLGEVTATASPLHEVMAKEYGGKPDEWAKMLTPELMGALSQEGSVGSLSPEEHAARLVEAMPIDRIDPKPFERLAKKSSDYIQKAAEQARTGSAAGAKASSAAAVAVLHTYEMARDVNLAKAAKASEVVAELEKVHDKIATQATNQKLRTLMRQAGAPVLHLFDALTEGTGISPLRQGWASAHQDAVDAGAAKFSPEATGYADARMAGAFAEARQWFADQSRPFSVDEAALQRFLVKPRPWGDLIPAEARKIADAVKQLATTAREENIVRRGDAEATVRDAQVEISAELRQNPSKGLPKESGIPFTWWERLLLDANAANAVQLRPKNNLRQKSQAAASWIFDRINQGLYLRNDLFRDVGEQYKAAFEAVPKEIADRRYETYDLSAKLPTLLEPMKAVPRQWLWKLAQHRMSAGNMERVTSTSGWDASTLDSILFDDPKTKLTVPEWDYLQALADVKEKSIWPRLKAHFEKFYGQAPPKVAGVPFRVKLDDGTWKDYAGGYEPLKMDARRGVAPQKLVGGLSDYWEGGAQNVWTPGSAMERVDNSRYRVNMDWDSGRSAVAQTLHFLALDQPVRDVGKLINDSQLAADMREYMGQGRADMTHGWLKSVATQQAQSLPEGMEIVGRAFGWQRKLQLMQIVGGSARLALAQASHPIGLMLGGEVNPVHGGPALLSIFKPFTTADGEVRLFPNWNDAILNGKEVQKRADSAYNTLREGWDPAGAAKRGPLGALGDIAKKTAGLYLHAIDRLTTTWAWTSFHNEAVAKGAEPLSPEAIAYADGRTQDVMPSHDETAAPILTNRQVGGFLIMHGFKNALYNMRQDALARSVRELNLAETPGETGSAIARTAGRVALQAAMFGGFAIMGKFVLGSGQQRDESKGQYLARDFMAGQTADLPLVGGFGEPLAKLLSGLPARLRGDAFSRLSKHDFTIFGNPGVAAVVKAQEILGSLVNEGREDYKKVFDLVEAAMFFGGVPSRAPRVGAEHIYKQITGQGYDDPETTRSDSVGHLFYTDKQWDSVKRTLTPDED